MAIRNLIDTLYNLMLDHAQITIAPPIMFGRASGINTKKIKWGIGEKWQVGDLNQVREVQISKSDLQGITQTDLLLGIVQKLFGITDYSLGSESNIASNKTATGIVSLIQEGNVKFDHFIRRLQAVNKKEFQFIHKLNVMYLDRDMEFAITGGMEQPYGFMNRSILAGEFDFEMTGNTINTNDRIRQESASFLFNTYMGQLGVNPFVTPEMLRILMIKFNDAFNFNYQVKTMEQIKKEQIEVQQMAVRKEQFEQQLKQVQAGQASGQMNDDQVVQATASLQQEYADVIQATQAGGGAK